MTNFGTLSSYQMSNHSRSCDPRVQILFPHICIHSLQTCMEAEHPQLPAKKDSVTTVSLNKMGNPYNRPDIDFLGQTSRIFGHCRDVLKVCTSLPSSLWASPLRPTQSSKTGLRVRNRKCQILAHPSNVRKCYWYAPHGRTSKCRSIAILALFEKVTLNRVPESPGTER